MAVTDYSENPGANTAISGININEGCPPGNVNNALRQLMADLAAALADQTFVTGDFQPEDATLTALAGVTTAANKVIYATGSDAFTTADLTATGRSVIGAADLPAIQTLLGILPASISGDGTSGVLTIGTFKFAWRDGTAAANSSSSITYGSSTVYTSWARAWWNGGFASGNQQDNNPYVSSAGLSSATVYSAVDVSTSGVLFSIGV